MEELKNCRFYELKQLSGPSCYLLWLKAFVLLTQSKYLCKVTSILEPLQELVMIARRKKLKVLRK